MLWDAKEAPTAQVIIGWMPPDGQMPPEYQAQILAGFH